MHSFAKQAPHPEKLLEDNTLKHFLHNAGNLAKTKEAIQVFEAGQYKDFDLKLPVKWSPKYFGGAVEFLAETFFEVFGAEFNIQGIKSTDDFESTEADIGVDHTAQTIFKATTKDKVRIAQPLSPVFIQTKGTLNPNKEYTTNDGSRLMNFFAAAQVMAMHTGHTYSARYVLFTTGKGLHYRLNDNTGGICEVINSRAIRKRVDNNVYFWNKMRYNMNIALQKEDDIRDTEARLNMAANS